MTETSTKTSRWRRIVLPVSLAFNLFFVALVGSHVLHVYKSEEKFGAPFGRALARAEAILPPQDAATFKAAIERTAPQFNQDFQNLAEARRALGRQVSAEQFDRGATRQALTGLQTASDRLINDFGDTLVDALAGLSPEGRQKLAKEFRAERPPPED